MRADHWFRYWETLAARYASRPALIAEGAPHSLSYQELFRLSVRLAAALQQCGIREASPVIVCLRNTIWAPVTQIALAMLAACDLPVAHSATPDDLDRISRQAATRWLVTDRPSDDLPSTDSWSVMRPDELVGFEGNDGLTIPVQAGALPPIRLSDHEIAREPGRALPSSGTTGLPKVSVYTQAARRAAHELQCALLPCRPVATETLVLVTPFSHGGSLLAWAWWDAGGCVDLLPGMDVGVLLHRLEVGAAAAFLPPTVLHKIVDALPAGKTLGTRTVFTGTQSLDAGLYRRARRAFGPAIRVTYGKSECINPICYSQPGDTDVAFKEAAADAGSCVGIPAIGVELRITADDAGDPGVMLPSGQPGTVWVKAAHMSAGLWEAGRLRPWPQGWHNTEDRGHIDGQGRLWLLGRRGDTIKTGGYLVQLEAVEAIARNAWPGRDLCAIAWPSSMWGAVVTLVIKDDGTLNGTPPSQLEIDAAYAAHAKPLRPRIVIVAAALPVNAQGKPLRRRLLDALMEHHELEDGSYPRLRPRHRVT